MNKKLLFKLFAVVTAMMCAFGASAAEAYACYTSDNTTLTFYYDNQRSSRPGDTYDLNTGANYPDWYLFGTFMSCSKVVFNPSFAGARPTTAHAWFYQMNKLTSITGLNYLNTENVTNMHFMFFNCRSLTSLDVSGFNTSNVSDMSYMFYNCTDLTSLDLSGFNTVNVTTMLRMFDGCSALTSLDVSGFNTENVTDMSYMFNGCSGLRRLDLSSFNTPKVENVLNMFSNCSNLLGIDISHFDISSITYLDCMFDGCSNLTSLDLSSFNTENVIETSCMFRDCSDLVRIYVSDLWNMDNVDYSGLMFDNCLSLVGEQGTTYDSNYTGSFFARVDGGPSNPGYLSYKEAPEWTSHFEKDGIYYLITGGPNTVWVTYKDENYNSYGGEVTIPSTVTYGGKTYTVKAIDNRAFRHCTGLMEVTIPATVNLIGYIAFENCPSLQTIKCLAVMPPQAFENTFSSYSATLYVPRGSVENYADAPYWSNFTNILEIGGNQVFEYNGLYYSITGDNTVMVTYKNTDYNSYSGDITIPETVIYNYKTYYVTAIGTRAFYNCTELTSVTIGSNVTAIGDEAFRNCTNLGATWGWYLTIPDAVTTIGYSAFRNCNRIYRVDLGSGVTFIDNVAFECDGLYTVVCTSPVPPRTDYAFTTFNYTYTDVYVPKGSLTAYRDYYEWGEFHKLYERPNYDFELDGLYYQIQPDSTTVHVVRNYDGLEDETYFYTEQEYNIPETVSRGCDTYTVTGIDKLAFWYCTNLQHISLPKTIQEIGDRAFDQCTNLQSLYCHAMTPPELGYGIFDESVAGDVVVAVPKSAFSTYEQTDGWDELGLFELDYDFEQDGFFYRITDSRNVALAQKENHFNYLVYKGYIDMPWTVKHQDKTYWVNGVYQSAFVGCRDLTAVCIGYNVASVGSYAFDGCTGLKRVTIPEVVSSLGRNAFRGCTSLETVTCHNSTPPTIYSNTFESATYSNATLRVPRGSKSSYQAADFWTNFLNIEEFYHLNDALNVEGGEYEFESDGVFAWNTVEEGGRAYAMSGNAGVPNSTSTLTVWVYAEENSILSFDFKAWGDGEDYVADKCIFALDSVEQFCYGARDNDWETYSVEVTPGWHALEWRYDKDYEDDPEGDYFAVDNVQLLPPEVSLDQALNVAGGTIHFISNGDYPWTVQSEGDRVYAKSGNAGAQSSFSGIRAEVSANEGDILTFDFKAWGQSRGDLVKDACLFSIDGVAQFKYGALDNDWETYSVTLEAGEHILTWVYSKDEFLDPEGDYFAVDNVKITAGAPAFTRGDVNGDGSVNISDVTALIDYLLSGNASGINVTAADCNQDSLVNISDVTALIDYLLSGSWN